MTIKTKINSLGIFIIVSIKLKTSPKMALNTDLLFDIFQFLSRKELAKRASLVNWHFNAVAQHGMFERGAHFVDRLYNWADYVRNYDQEEMNMMTFIGRSIKQSVDYANCHKVFYLFFVCFLFNYFN